MLAYVDLDERFSYTGTLEVIEEGLHHLTEAVAKLE
jgi:hypothetical protein